MSNQSVLSQTFATIKHHWKSLLLSILLYPAFTSLSRILVQYLTDQNPSLNTNHSFPNLALWFAILFGQAVICTLGYIPVLLSICLIHRKENLNAASIPVNLLANASMLMKLLILCLLQNFLPNLTGPLLRELFIVVYTDNFPSYVYPMIILLPIAAGLLCLLLTYYLIPRRTAELAADQSRDSFCKPMLSDLAILYAAVIVLLVITSVLAGINTIFVLPQTILKELITCLLPLAFYRALLPLSNQ